MERTSDSSRQTVLIIYLYGCNIKIRGRFLFPGYVAACLAAQLETNPLERHVTRHIDYDPLLSFKVNTLYPINKKNTRAYYLFLCSSFANLLSRAFAAYSAELSVY